MLSDFKAAVASKASREQNLKESEFCLQTIQKAYRSSPPVPA